MIFATSKTLAAPTTARGQNVYLGVPDFWVMMVVALVLHLGALMVVHIMPREEVITIPVRVLNIKLGGGDRLSPRPAPMQATPEPVAEVKETSKTEAPTIPAFNEQKAPAPAKPAPIKTVKSKSASKPAPEPTPLPSVSVPHEYVREGYAANGMGKMADPGLASGKEDPESVMLRYEQLLSSWIERHKVYPPAALARGVEGRAVVRVRIDRQGNVKFYAIEQATDSPLLNQAAMEMVRRANPVPAVPANYPAGQLLEFLIPVTFRLPK